MKFGANYLLTLCGGFLLAVMGARLGTWWGQHFDIITVPGGRRRHKRPLSRLGGLGIALGFFGALALSYYFLPPIPTADPKESQRFWGLVIGGFVIFLIGLLDDYRDLPPWTQYGGYLLAALIAVRADIILERFNHPLANEMIILPALLYIPLTIFWITGMIVTVNWLDGLDGLAAGVAAILAAILTLHMLRVEQYSVAPLALALLGASLGFLVYNIPPARVFMGSSGAFLLGYLMGALGLIAGGRVATVLLVMGIPIVDVAWTILDRWRHGVSPLRGDRRHLHYRLQDAGLSTRVIVFIYWGFCALAGAMALLLSSRLYKLMTLVLLSGITLIALLYLSERQ